MQQPRPAAQPQQIDNSQKTLPDTVNDNEEAEDTIIPQWPNREQTSLGNVVVLNNFDDSSLLYSWIQITGAVPSSWVFEGIFPVEIRTDRGVLVEEWYAEADIFDEEGNIIDWLAPFVLHLEFTTPSPVEAESGVLRLMADNTLGVPEEERDMVDIMVLFE